MITETARVGKRGIIVIPAALRQKYGFEEGSQVVVEPVPEGLLLRPVVTLPIEIYTPERKAEFLLNNAITPDDYSTAVKQVREMGLDPEKIPHKKIGKR
jgi:AbrB family looped-hinge helix DNA binding protein